MEYLDILDEDGNKTGKFDTRENIHKTGLLHSEVSAFIYTNTGKILLQKRKNDKKTYSGIWSVTGGHVISGENNEDAIVREIKEELNLDVKKEDIEFVYVYKSKKISDNIINNKFFSVYIIEINEEKLNSIKIQTEELEETRLFSIDGIKDIMKNEDKRYKFPQNSEYAVKRIEILKYDKK